MSGDSSSDILLKSAGNLFVTAAISKRRFAFPTCTPRAQSCHEESQGQLHLLTPVAMPEIWDFTCIYSNYGPLNVRLGLDTSVNATATGDSRVYKCAYQRSHSPDTCVKIGATFLV
jgi:hypothetical protein